MQKAECAHTPCLIALPALPVPSVVAGSVSNGSKGCSKLRALVNSFWKSVP